MKFIIIANSSHTIISFRLSLIKELLNLGHDVLVVAGDSEAEAEIKKNNIDFISLSFSNRSINIFENLKYKRNIAKIIATYEPDYILTFQAKPNTIAVLGAKKYLLKHNECKLICMVEGLGDPFINTNLKWKIIRKIECLLYKKSLSLAKSVYFLNSDDAATFLKLKLCKKNQIRTIRGIGIDLQKFLPCPLPNVFTVGYATRLIKNKGIIDYCKIAKKCHETNKSVRFVLAGPEAEITKKDILPFINSGDIEYLGEVSDMPKFYESISIFSSCSLREGFPVTIMESMSCGRPVVAYDVAGVRDAVDDKKDGLLIKPHDIDEFVNAILELKTNVNSFNKLSNCAQKKAKDCFDANIIQKHFIKDIFE